MLQQWMNQFAREHKHLPEHLRYSEARMKEYYDNMRNYFKCQDYLQSNVGAKQKVPSVVGFYPYYAESYCNKVNGNWSTVRGKGSRCLGGSQYIPRAPFRRSKSY